MSQLVFTPGTCLKLSLSFFPWHNFGNVQNHVLQPEHHFPSLLLAIWQDGKPP